MYATTTQHRESALLGEELALRTEASIEEIARALLRIDPTASADVSLGSGAAGLALFHSSYARYASSEEHNVRAHALAEKSLARIRGGDSALGPGLHNGIAGIACALAQVCDREDDFFHPVDVDLLHATARGPFAHGYDLVSGLVGIGIYAIRRRHVPECRELLQQTTMRLLELSVRRDAGLTWEWDPKWSGGGTRAGRVEREVDIGVAHGVAGVMPILGAACHILSDKSAAIAAYEGARDWLVSQALDLDFATYPAILSPARPPEPARHSWCYGDVGIAAALHAAAQWTADGVLTDHARAVAERATRRSFESAGYADASLCHGTAGVAHLYNLLFRATGRPLLGRHATKLFEETIRMRVPGEGVGGFLAFEPLSIPRLNARAGLLEGAAGIGLSQLSAVCLDLPVWEDLLGFVLPSPGEVKGSRSGNYQRS